MFPLLAGLNVVRTWAALRVMSPDGFPIYEQSATPSRRLRGDLPLRRDARRQPCPDARARMIAAGRLAGRRSRPFSPQEVPCSEGCLSARGHGASRFTVDGKAAQARAGDTVAAALLAAGIEHCRTTPVSGAPRAPYCMMGVCFECLVVIDGVGNRQGCLVPVREGMRVETQTGARAIARGQHEPADVEALAATLRPRRRRRRSGRPCGRRTAAAELGLAVLLLDEKPAPGGQIYRAVTTDAGRRQGAARRGLLARRALVARVRALGGASMRAGAIGVVGDADSTAPASRSASRSAGRARMIPARAGHPGHRRAGAAVPDPRLDAARRDDRRRRADRAEERPASCREAARCSPAAARCSSCSPGSPRAGAQHRGDPRHHAARQLARARCRICRHFLRSPYLAKGLKLMREVRRQVRVVSGVDGPCAPRARTASTAVAYAEARQRAAHRRLSTRCCCTRASSRTSISSNAAGCAHGWDDVQLAWTPELDDWFATSVAGHLDRRRRRRHRRRRERGRARPARGARRGAPARPHRRGRARPRGAPRRARAARALARARASSTRSTGPPGSSACRTDDTIVCRCEEVTAGQIRDDRARSACTGPNQMKAFLRCGMGPCQGRLCGLTVTELIARGARRVAGRDVGYYRLRPPVKPITLG